MAATTEVQVVIHAKDNATATLNSVGKGIKGVGEESRLTTAQLVAGTAALGGMLAAAGKLVGGMIQTASSMEQSRIAFQTMLGSADLARKTLSDLSDFARKTPFDLPQLVDASQRLLAYNVSAQDLIPTLEMLGNISAGVGREKLPQLILAFGQVKAATKLTGAELRQFSEAGVPLLQALVDQANESGGALVKVGGSAKKTGKDVGELNFELARAKQRLKEASDSGKTKASTMMTLQHNVQKYEAELAKANKTAGGTPAVFTRVKTTAEQMKKAIEDGTVSFEDVQKALQRLSTTKFAGLMIEQSKSLGGIVSNLRDVWARFSMEVIGVQANGDIREGSIFTMLKKGALGLLDVLEKVQGPVIGFIDSILKNQTAFSIITGAILGLVAAVGVGLVMALGAVLAPIAGLIAGFLAVGAGVGLLINALGGIEKVGGVVVSAFTDIQNFVTNVGNELGKLQPVIQGYLDEFTGQFKAFGERVYDSFKLDASNIGFTDFFAQLWSKIEPELTNVVAQIQQGFKNAFTINFGEGGNIGDLFGRLMAIIQPVADLFWRVLTPAIDALKNAFIQMKPQLDILLQQLGPILINVIQILVGALAGFLVIVIGVFSGLVTAVATALPFVIQLLTGLAEFINGVLNIIVGLFTLNWNQVWEGVKLVVKGIYDTIVGGFGAVLGFVGGFIKGIITFFQNLYNVLVGHSIVPDLVEAILGLFNKLKDGLMAIGQAILSAITEKFEQVKTKIIESVNAAKNWIAGQIGEWANWGRNLGQSFVDGFWNALQALKQKAIDALNAAKSVLQGHSPPSSGPFKEIDKWGYNIGDSWVQGFAGALGSLSRTLEAPMLQAQPAMVQPVDGQTTNVANAGRTIAGGVDEGFGGVSFEVNIGLYAGSETEKRNIARDLYQALLTVANAQNKTVQELMGG